MRRISTILLLLLFVVTGANAKFIYWSYCDKDIAGAYGSQTSGKAAIYIPAEVAQAYVGKTLTGVRVGLASDANSLKAFLCTSLDGSLLMEKQADQAAKGPNVVKFDTPYTITGEGFYVGVEYSGTKAVLGYSSCKSTNGNFTNFGTGWTNNGSNGANALSIAARIEGDVLPVDLAIANMFDMAVKKDTPFQITGKLMNFSASKVYSYRLAYSFDGEEEKMVSFDDEQISERSEATFSISHNGLSEEGTHNLKVRIVDVDGEEDVYAGNNTATCNVFMTSIAPTKRAVMEEFTGLMCGNCPRGIVAIEKCLEAYPDNFIAIAKHNYTIATPAELKSPTYDYEIASSWPYCVMNRFYEFDPEPATALQYTQAIVNIPADAGVDATANFVAGDETKVNAHAVAQFISNNANANYRFAFAIVEDGVKGYNQNNAYSGGSLGSLDGWENKGTMVPVTLNHVARMGFGVKEGIEGSIPSSISNNSLYSYDVVLQLPTTIQDKNNLKLVVLLLNKSNGMIENAVQVPVLEADETSVADVNNMATPDISINGGRVVAEGFDGNLQVYTIGGERVANGSLKSGVYIVRGVSGKQTFVKRIAF